MRPITEDEKQLVLRRLPRDMARLRADAGNLGLLGWRRKRKAVVAVA